MEEKSNEITAIPELLDKIQIKGQVVTIDAMGTQTALAEKIQKKRADYVLALKGNQGNLHEDVKLYQMENISWLTCKKEWKGLKSIGMEEKTIRKDGLEKKEYRFFITSLSEDIALFSRAVRGHWSVESMHWHLDVTFREDANQTLDRQAAQNLNIIRKWCLSILKVIELFRPNLSMKKKRFIISMNPPEFLDQVLAF